VASLGAVLDANVLIKASLRDTLIRAYGANLYRLHWSNDILTEVTRSLVANRMTTEAGAERLERVFRTVLEDAEVTGYVALVPAMTNDPTGSSCRRRRCRFRSAGHRHREPARLLCVRAGSIWDRSAIA
jgi:hypothetical protein